MNNVNIISCPEAGNSILSKRLIWQLRGCRGRRARISVQALTMITQAKYRPRILHYRFRMSHLSELRDLYLISVIVVVLEFLSCVTLVENQKIVWAISEMFGEVI
jgi:hypothetical protein